MAAAKERVDARQPRVPTSGDTLAAVPDVDAGWLAQAIEARKLALRLHQLHPKKDLTSVVHPDVHWTEPTEDASKLLADYLAASEKLFNLAAALAGTEHSSRSPSRVDNSNGVSWPDGVSNERIEE